ncbi:MAG: tRNA (adenosine(37)-N6)-dimethylallyltransferase MiaA [Rickettsiales bacterium]|jgi:tRNA dimethylallyltransferase|nr:tRNA (adenosine(37)-N6)-dimethylallyltransferase MiaA [Rickettsiales bacterium]
MEIKSYIITGPTASGKSDFAHALAKRANGVIINADAVQVYRGIENISASPLAGLPHCRRSDNLIDEVPYRLYSITAPDAPLSAGAWAKMARAEYDAALSAGKTPIFVGGAGFYLRALTVGFSDIPEIAPEFRDAARAMQNGYEFLKQHDPQWAVKISPNDRQRIARGIEVFLATGRTLSEFQSRPNIRILPEIPHKILILPPKEVVLERIARRMKILDVNSENEVRAIMNLPRDLPVMRADGVLEISKYLRGEISRDEAMNQWRRKIERGNCKRQYTWFRTQFSADAVIDHLPTDADIGCFLI